jgi:CspA family cold shock protein
MEAKIKGWVKWYDPIRGYGFGERLDGSGEVFIHRGRLIDAEDDMKKGAMVLFTVKNGNKKPIAVDVELAKNVEVK